MRFTAPCRGSNYYRCSSSTALVFRAKIVPVRVGCKSETQQSALFVTHASTKEAPGACSMDKEVMLVEVNGRSRKTFQSSGQYGSLRTEEQPSTSGSAISGDISDFLRSFILPKGYPQSVTDDYLGYQLRALPAHITGWMSKSLATSSLIHALGVGMVGPTGTVAASAAIKWIAKDGIGAFGRFLVGGRLGGVFDEDPRRWRMIAVGFATVGLALEIATTAFPSSFLLLASAGNFTKAVGKGLSQPCFRIIQTHFAQSNNVGDISAKEEVWEVTAQLLGLASSVSLLRAIESGGKPQAVLWIWALVQVVHVCLRYLSLDYLRFPELNQKRATILAAAHAAGEEVPSIREANEREPMLASSSGVKPCITIGIGVEAAFAGTLPGRQQLIKLQQIFAKERYWLIWRGGRGDALLLEGHTATDILRLLWQGAWLDAQGIFDATNLDYKNSLDALDQRWPSFESQLRQQKWDPDRNVYKLGEQRICFKEVDKKVA